MHGCILLAGDLLQGSSDFLKSRLLEFHNILLDHFGDPGWWPGDSSLEISIGAILTQNTSWNNVERTIEHLKAGGLIDVENILSVPGEDLADVIRPSGYFNQKSSYIKGFAFFLKDKLEGSVEGLSSFEMHYARSMLLEVKGIGKETADSILCYAAGFPVLVIDAYTFRIMGRYLGKLLPMEEIGKDYDRMASFLMNILDGDNQFYNRFHALVVLLGKDVCRKSPDCSRCPLDRICAHGSI